MFNRTVKKRSSIAYMNFEILEERNVLSGVSFSLGEAILPETFVSEPSGMLARDVDKDGHSDLIVSSQSGFGWFKGNPAGFEEYQQLNKQRVVADTLLAADMNGDEELDLIAAASSSYYFQNLGDGFFEDPIRLSGSFDRTFIADVLGTETPELFITRALHDRGNHFVTIEGRIYPDRRSFVALKTENLGTPENAENVAMVAADVDGDQDTDIVYASPLADRLNWFENNDGEFMDALPLAGSNSYSQLLAGDFDGNGIQDFIGVNQNSLTLLRNEQGTLNVEQTITLDANPIVQSHDLDEDGDLDLVASQSDELIIIENSRGRLQIAGRASLDDPINGIAVIPSRDSMTIVTSHLRNDRIIVNEFNEHFEMYSQSVLTESRFDNPRDLQMVDLNLDDSTDLVFLAAESNLIAWIPNALEDEATVPNILIDKVPETQSLMVQDLVGDMLPDLITWNTEDSFVTIFQNLGSNSFSDPQRVDASEQEIAALIHSHTELMWPQPVDINNDGHLDSWEKVGVSGTTNGIRWNPGLGDSQYGPGQVIFGSEKQLDQVTFAPESSSLFVVESSLDKISRIDIDAPAVRFSGPIAIKTDIGQYSSIEVVDIDGDGFTDIIHATRSEMHVWKNDGSGRFHRTWSTTFLNGYSPAIHIADLNGDGLPDIVSHSAEQMGTGFSISTVWFRNTGDGFSSPLVLRTYTDNRIRSLAIHSFDSDNDGDIDLFINQYSGDQTSRRFYFYENIGNDEFADAQRFVPTRTPLIMDSLDVNNDGLLDILGANAWAYFWYQNLGDNRFSDSNELTNNETFRFGKGAMAFLDWHNNGRQGVVHQSSNFWYRNGSAEDGQYRRVEIPEFRYLDISSVTQGDIDLDGDVDLVLAGPTLDAFHNDGSNEFPSRTRISYAESDFDEIHLSDLDGDGDLDIIVETNLNDAPEQSGIFWFRNEVISTPEGDLNADGRIDVADMDALCAAIHDFPNDERFDVNQDQTVDRRDIEAALDEIFHVPNGDVNFDRSFDSGDLVRIFQNGTFETNDISNWSSGDLDCDGRFTTHDLVLAFQLDYE